MPILFQLVGLNLEAMAEEIERMPSRSSSSNYSCNNVIGLVLANTKPLLVTLQKTSLE